MKNRIVNLILVVSIAMGQLGGMSQTAYAEESATNGEITGEDEITDIENDSSENEENADENGSSEKPVEGTDNEDQNTQNEYETEETSENPAAENEQTDISNEQESGDTDNGPRENEQEGLEDETNPESLDESSAESGSGDEQVEEEPLLSDENNAASEDTLISGPFDYEADIDGYHINLHAESGVLPDETEVKIQHLAGEDDQLIEKQITDKCGDQCYYSTSFDISFYTEDGEEIQPVNGSVDVSFDVSEEMVTEAELCGISEISVIHFDDKKGAEPVDAETDEENTDNLLTTETDTEVYHSEDGTLIESNALLASSPSDEEAHSMTVNFSAESFSVYSLVLIGNYQLNPVNNGGEYVIDLTDESALKSDFFSYVQQAFKYASDNASASQRYRVRLPQNGNYKIGGGEKTLKMGSNTTFDLNGSYILNDRCHGMIMGTTGANTNIGGYGDFQNMAIVNGTLDANAFAFSGEGFVTTKFAHITGLRIENVTFLNSRGHSIEVVAAKDVVIKGCSFQHYTYPGEKNDEAINIDAAHEGWVSLGSTQKPNMMGPYDDYCCDSVEISGCSFNDLYRAVGSHNSLVGQYHNNISIYGNTMSDIKNYAIGCPHYTNSSIYSNNITGCGRGIDGYVESYAIFSSAEHDSHDENHNMNVQISNNSINLGSDVQTGYPYGIRVGGMSISNSDEIDSGQYYSTGYSITNNVMNGFEAGVFVCYTKGTSISGNNTNGCTNGYDINGNSEIQTFESNATNNSGSTGILVRDSSKVYNSAGNTVVNSGSEDVDIQSGSNAVFFVNTSKYLIGIGEALKLKVYSGNNDSLIFSSSKKKAIKISNSGKVKGKKKGSSVITAQQDDCKGTVKVSAKKAPTKVKISKKKTLKKGKSFQIVPKVNKGAACAKYKFSTSNKSIVKVSSTGVVKARKKGRATITVTAYNGVSSKMTIVVK